MQFEGCCPDNGDSRTLLLSLLAFIHPWQQKNMLCPVFVHGAVYMHEFCCCTCCVVVKGIQQVGWQHAWVVVQGFVTTTAVCMWRLVGGESMRLKHVGFAPWVC